MSTCHAARHEDCLPLNQEAMELAGNLKDTIETDESYELAEPAEIETMIIQQAESPPEVPTPVGQSVEAVDEVQEPDDLEQGRSQQPESCLRGCRAWT